jgi:DNA topoisomerase-1
MSVAQKLYEGGKITYMRTDSTNLSQLAINTAAKVISSEYGENYSKPRQYRKKSKGAQEAHEAIRPTYIENKDIKGKKQEERLYNLIWKRMVASQMSNAQVERTTITVGMSNSETNFFAHGEVIKFDGFIKVYKESTDTNGEKNGETLIPPVTEGLPIDYKEINAIEKYTVAPPRFTEASLVKKMEELGIGRPSTYAPVISTIQNRGYVSKEDRSGTKRKIRVITLSEDRIVSSTKTENAGVEKSKLFPMDIGIIVNDFLIDNFKNIFEFNFTADVEVQFDQIAEGKLTFPGMLEKFYSPFHLRVQETLEQSERKTGSRELGTFPETGEPVFVKMGRFGPVAQIGEPSEDSKPRFASLLKGQLIETISLEEVLELFKLPRTIGEYEDNDLVIGVGRYGPYVKHKNKFYSLKEGTDDPLEIGSDRAIELIEEKRDADKKKVINTFGEILVLHGRYGPYITFEKKNYKIPRKTDPATLTEEDCKNIIEKAAGSKKK